MTVKEKTRTIIWARAAGCCEYRSCNESLIGDLVSGHEDATFGFIAHIVAEKATGPRGDPVRSPLLVNDPDNLMLLCAKHHKLIDIDARDAHPETLLREMKKEHEDRMRTVTAIGADRATHIVRYGARVGDHTSAVSYELVRTAVLPDWYPADASSIAIELLGSATHDRDAEYWSIEVDNLRKQFARRVRARLDDGEIRHLSVFALAPIPLLIELGRLLGDISFASVYQLHREPKGWRWAESGNSVGFTLERPQARAPKVALSLAISSVIDHDRVRRVLGSDTEIWSITASPTGNDVVRSPDDLIEFRKQARTAFAAIKAANPTCGAIHVFPAVPVSIAVELGRVWMPKADLPLIVYDETPGCGFVPRLEVRSTDGPGTELLATAEQRRPDHPTAAPSPTIR
jgi:hypothetical protein